MNGTEKVERVRTTEIPAHLGQRVRVQGWMQTLRLLGGINFVIVRDGWGTVQAVTEDEADFGPIVDNGYLPETVIALEGIVTASDQAPGGFELHSPTIEVITPVTEPLPVKEPPLSSSSRIPPPEPEAP